MKKEKVSETKKAKESFASSDDKVATAKLATKKRKKKEEITDEQLREMFSTIRQKSTELRNVTDKLQDKFMQATGVAIRDLEKIIDNPQNFTQKEWNEIQKLKLQQEAELRKLYDALGLDYDKEVEKEQKKKMTRKKRKCAGLRKKGWIQM